ncbi:MAG: glycosyl transferase [Sphingobacteriales bacterium]|nr:glycosyl transferase [Sphingobacteriales bacterium]
MRILYAIQGTGNGHLSRARDIIPILLEQGELDILISGTEAEVELPYPVKYRFKGLSFVFGKKGGIDLLSTYKKSNIRRLFGEIQQLPVEDYDIVLNDFEPVSAWACRWKGIPCIGLSHQAAVINKKSPKPKKSDLVGQSVLKNYAPVTKSFGFHFKPYDKHIFTPVIRAQIRTAIPENHGHYTVYLPAYSDKRIIRILGQLPDVRWEVFSKHAKETYSVDNININRINNDLFIKSMVNCKGMFCGAGFETPAEALFLKKKVLVIPMKGQYEQQCNAAALAELGVPVIKSLKEKHLPAIRQWVNSGSIVPVDYPDETVAIIDRILIYHKTSTGKRKALYLGGTPQSHKKFWQISLQRIFKQLAR